MKKVFVFGSQQCPDCVVLKEFLEANQVRFTFIDILDSLGKMTSWIRLRRGISSKISALPDLRVTFLWQI